MDPKVASVLVDVLGDAVVFDVPLGAKTTYRVGGHASAAVRATSRESLAAIARALGECTNNNLAIDVVVLGNGSNMLVADAGFDGLAVQLHPAFCSEIQVVPDAGADVVRVGGAVALPVAARRISRLGLAGFEWAVGVPGSIGGAVKMNAGGHGSDMAASLVAVEVFALRGPDAGTSAWLPASDLQLGYRTSSLRTDQLVLNVDLQLSPGDVDKSAEILDEIVGWRRANQPGGQNCGSVFTNPPGDSAGRLIDSLGLAGLRIGTAEVSTRHANFVQADPDGTATDVLAVIREVQKRVAKEAGIDLVPEVRLVGNHPAP